MSALVEGAGRLGIHLSPGHLARFDQLQAALLEWNQRVNLTRITDPAAIETRHYLDSLTAALPLLGRLQAGEALRLVDIGSGAGFPGLPLKIVFPALRVTLVESTRKKATFIRAAVEMLNLDGVEVAAERAETLATRPDHRDGYDWATGRAVGSLPQVLELAAPFLAPGGLLVAQRSGDLERAVEAAAPVYGQLKLWSRASVTVALPGLEGRGLVVAEKYAPTPKKFPRRPGMARKEPLG